MMSLKNPRGALKAFGAALCAGFTLSAAHAAPSAPDTTLVERGAYLAKAGDCIACHTTARGKPFAGGLKMMTPMGAIYSTNITPDAQTGIGADTEEEFARALRAGVARDGHNLYPAMPYPSYAKMKDDDAKALYAYFMHGVAPVKQANRPSDIPWPLNMRWPIKLWNMVYLDTDMYQDKAGKDAAWNRGAYLVQGLGHCGACHTPRGLGIQEEALDERLPVYLRGMRLDNWFAANLSSERNVGLGDWSGAELVQFLQTGANAHATAFGSMTSVINHSTQGLTDYDVAAMAYYLKSLPASGGAGAQQYTYDGKSTQASLAKPAQNAGARVYTAYCMHCHGVDGHGFAPMLAPLAGNPNVLAKDPSSLINVTLNGTDALVVHGISAPYPMPKFAAALNDQQIAEVLTFIRAGWNDNAPAVSAGDVAKLRHVTQAAR